MSLGSHDMSILELVVVVFVRVVNFFRSHSEKKFIYYQLGNENTLKSIKANLVIANNCVISGSTYDVTALGRGVKDFVKH